MNRPDSFFAALTRVRTLFVLGLIGLALAAACTVAAIFRGSLAVGAEGDLSKAITFDGAVGIYLLTLGFFVPLADFTAQGLRRWLGWSIGIFAYAYGLETTQTLRGLDPRFTKVGTPVDRILGGVFFVVALGVITLFCILAVKLWRHSLRGSDGVLLLGIRYAIGATAVAFAAGLWMSAAAGRRAGPAGNILPLHAIGFHGLQAVPLVAWLLSRSTLSDQEARRWVHLAGAGWIAACLAIAWQTAAGQPVTEFSIAMALAVLAVLAWSLIALRAARARIQSKAAGVTGY
ncbi:MAG TPA: hypothetical protein VMH05_23380 [Bryobacteraceae bacterium]|nr:hypothetical protein [Bryobacteraceae bacterium]